MPISYYACIAKRHKARKEYTCSLCGKKINKGEEYIRELADLYERATLYWHPRCYHLDFYGGGGVKLENDPIDRLWYVRWRRPKKSVYTCDDELFIEIYAKFINDKKEIEDRVICTKNNWDEVEEFLNNVGRDDD